MKDRKFLQWIHDRLIYRHYENKNTDHMRKLRAIIADYDDDKVTANVCSQSDYKKPKEEIE